VVQPSPRGSADGGGPTIGPFKRYGRYTLVKKLATGGMAEIWLARQRGLADFKRMVVIKKILSHLSAQETFVKMFLDEARMSAQLNHPNIVQVYDLGREGESYFIAMEFINGENLAAVAWRGKKKNRSLPVAYCARVLADACKGLHYAHHLRGSDGSPLNIVHRDISPQNILLTYEGETKVVDFGIAKAASRSEATKTGMLKGKFSYMSPEQCVGGHIDMRSDVFALGILLYELTTGTRLFKHESELMILEMITKRDVVPPREVNADIPAALDEIVMKALRKEPAERFQHAQEMQLALEDFIRENAKAATSNELAAYMRPLFSDHIEEKRQILELAARDDVEEVAFGDEETEQAQPAQQRRVVHGLSPSQVRVGPGHATGSNPQASTGMMYPPPHANASGMMYPTHAAGSPGMFPPPGMSMPGYPPGAAGSQYAYQPWPQPEAGPSWVARIVIIGALLVIAFASFILYRQIYTSPASQIPDAGTLASNEPIRTGELKLETDPPGARIILNGEPMRTADGKDALTPSDLQGLQYGRTFDIGFEKDGFHSEKRVILMGNGIDGTTINQKLRGYDGALFIEVGGKARDASIFINGEEVGQGPQVKKTLPGHQWVDVEARHPSFSCTPEPRRIMVEPNRTLNVKVTCNARRIAPPPPPPPPPTGLRPPPDGRPPPPPPPSGACSDLIGKATIGTNPEGAKLFIDGKDVGWAPLPQHKLATGCPHTVKAVWPDGTEKTVKINVEPNKVSIFRVPKE
jgi:serine/threonine-protein kinase